MTYNWLSTGYRVIPEWSGYVMSSGLEVWSLARQIRCKGGTTRQKSAMQLQPSKDGRVSLCQDGHKARYHVWELYRVVFPDLVEKEREEARQRPQVRCHNGHPLMEPINPDIFGHLTDIVRPNVAHWGTGNRICLYCSDAPEAFPTDNTYSADFGVSGMPDYSDLPATPRPVWRETSVMDELLETEHTFSVRNS